MTSLPRNSTQNKNKEKNYDRLKIWTYRASY